jgi:hypothetical protein
MPLRSVNNPNTDIAIMAILKSILPANTQLAASSQSGTGQELVFIQEKYKMSLVLRQDTPTSAVNITANTLQEYSLEAQRSYSGLLAIDVSYYTKWTGQNEDIDIQWSEICTDLERMKANVEEQDATEYSGTNHTISLEKIALSPYDAQFDDSIPGITPIKRVMTLTYNLLPYGA